MRKLALSCATLALFAFATSAQAQTVKTKVKQKPTETAAAKTKTVTKTDGPEAAAAPASKLDDYVGTYSVENLPFEEMVFSVKDGKLTAVAGDRVTPLTPAKDADTFDAGGSAVFRFLRGDDKKVKGLEMDAAGATFEGTKK